jgi:small subunit ribosomal protein S5
MENFVENSNNTDNQNNISSIDSIDKINNSEVLNSTDLKKTLEKLVKEKEGESLSFSESPRKRRKIRLSKIQYSEKILSVKRMTKVVKGGKINTFRAVVVIGNSKGMVGMGIGKAEDSQIAVEKGILTAKKSLIKIPLTHLASIPHIIQAKSGACTVILRPATPGTGVIAGGPVRTVLEFAGIRNILSKELGAKNIINNTRATILALSNLNEKVQVGKFQLLRKQKFYAKIMKRVRVY